jgi:hypothetical protein
MAEVIAILTNSWALNHTIIAVLNRIEETRESARALKVFFFRPFRVHQEGL